MKKIAEATVNLCIYLWITINILQFAEVLPGEPSEGWQWILCAVVFIVGNI